MPDQVDRSWGSETGGTSANAAQQEVSALESDDTTHREEHMDNEGSAGFELGEWGWDEGWAELFKGLEDTGWPARVTEHHRTRWTIQTSSGPRDARIDSSVVGSLRPGVGDWVVASPGPGASDSWLIVLVLPRRSCFSRGSALDGSEEQVLASNVDRAWIVHGLDRPVNDRSLERYLAVAWESGALPEFVLAKSDMADDIQQAVERVERLGYGTPVWVVGMHDQASIARLGDSLTRGRTVVLLGPSGAGKSTLVNLLAESDIAKTGSVREGDSKGRHTSTARQLFKIRGGGLLLDTPGLRQLRIWDLDAGLARAFPEIDELADGCRFRDCRHETEPGCAVLEAAQSGRLDPERLAGFRKLQAEAAYQLRKTDPRAKNEAIAEYKSIMKSMKHHPKYQSRK
jgi:ribosome biogenesis GTPase